MLLFRESGRLGNQIFQYAALRTLARKKESIVLIGFEELQKTFCGINAKIVNSASPKIERVFYHRLFSLLTQSQCACEIRESFKADYPTVTYSQKHCRQIAIVKKSYFQNESQFTPAAIESLNIRGEHFAYAKNVLEKVTQDKVPIFVHVRRGDYLIWPSKEDPAILTASYYEKCIEIIKSQVPNPFFVFVSDDPFYVKDLFGDRDNVHISEGSAVEDFVLMTQCKGGVLSASSFSWWAAYLSSAQHSPTIFLAPKYWAGHRSGTWYPKFIKSRFLEYVSS